MLTRKQKERAKEKNGGEKECKDNERIVIEGEGEKSIGTEKGAHADKRVGNDHDEERIDGGKNDIDKGSFKGGDDAAGEREEEGVGNGEEGMDKGRSDVVERNTGDSKEASRSDIERESSEGGEVTADEKKEEGVGDDEEGIYKGRDAEEKNTGDSKEASKSNIERESFQGGEDAADKKEEKGVGGDEEGIDGGRNDVLEQNSGDSEEASRADIEGKLSEGGEDTADEREEEGVGSDEEEIDRGKNGQTKKEDPHWISTSPPKKNRPDKNLPYPPQQGGNQHTLHRISIHETSNGDTRDHFMHQSTKTQHTFIKEIAGEGIAFITPQEKAKKNKNTYSRLYQQRTTPTPFKFRPSIQNKQKSKTKWLVFQNIYPI